jgi:carboxylesterase type B
VHSNPFLQFAFSSNLSFESKDCLYVNVYVPALQTPGRPLIVFVHGGGFVTGGAASDFSLYANGTGAVIVSVAYRLGSLGFLALPGMMPAFPTPTDPAAAVANVGLLDQQAALLWVRDNAAAFGAGARAHGHRSFRPLQVFERSFPARRSLSLFFVVLQSQTTFC